MATIDISADTVRVSLSRFEKFFGLLGDLEVPRGAVTSAEAVPSGLAALRGLRAPGLGLPGVRAIGTWRARGEKSYVSVRRNEPALRLRLTGCRYDTVLIGTDAAADLAVRLAPVAPRHG
jgi:hypothetical protein